MHLGLSAGFFNFLVFSIELPVPFDSLVPVNEDVALTALSLRNPTYSEFGASKD